jgi:hypothetical protein
MINQAVPRTTEESILAYYIHENKFRENIKSSQQKMTIVCTKEENKN